jgi:outer membrane receptor protein involved in Fe transport
VPLPTACNADLASLGLTAAPNAYGPDTIWNYEAGSKNTLGGGRATLNASVFYMNWKGLQQDVSLPCGFGFTANLGSAVSKGAEVQVRVEPVARLELSGSATYDEAYVTQTASGTGIRVGDPIQEAPKWSGSAALDYSLPSRLQRTWFGHLEYQYRGVLSQGGPRSLQSAVDPLSGEPFGLTRTIVNPAFETPAYHLINASGGLRASHWTVRGMVENLGNSRPLLGLSAPAPGVAFVTPTLRPRTFRLRLDFNF